MLRIIGLFAGILIFIPSSALAIYVDSSIREQANYCFPSGSASTHYNQIYVDQTTGTTTNFVVYDSSATEASQNNCWNMRQYSATKQHTSTTTRLNMVYEVVRNSGSCWMAWGTGTTTASVLDVTPIFTSGSSTATTSWVMNTSDAGVWVGGYSRNGQAEDCTFKVRRLYNTEGVEYLTFYNTSGGGTNSTTTIPLFTPLIVDRMTSMNCTISATATNCIPQYASTTNQVTPANLMWLSLFFLGSFFLAYWLIRKLTH